MAEIFPRFYYDNAITGATYTLSGGLSETPSFAWSYVSDWLDFTEFVWAGTIGAAATVASVKPLSAFGLWLAVNTDGGTYQLSAELSGAGNGYTVVATLVKAANDTVPTFVSFTQITLSAGAHFRVTRLTSGTSHYVREMFVGPTFTPERGMWSGVKPPDQAGTLVTSMTVSVNGSILGRNIRRMDRMQEVSFHPVTQAWVRGPWEAFQLAMAKYACFYQWNPVDYPNEVAFAAAEGITPSENTTPAGYMSVKMMLRILV